MANHLNTQAMWDFPNKVKDSIMLHILFLTYIQNLEILFNKCLLYEKIDGITD
jgi:hypothetical protein